MQVFIERYAGRFIAAGIVSGVAWLAKSGLIVSPEVIEAAGVVGLGLVFMLYDVAERKLRNIFKKDD